MRATSVFLVQKGKLPPLKTNSLLLDEVCFQIISIIQKTLVADSISGETGESKKIFSTYNPESKLSVGIPGHSCEQEKAGKSKMAFSGFPQDFLM